MSINSSLRHAGFKFPYRYPPANGTIEKVLSGVGGVLRAVGAALDEFGAMVHGSGSLKETGE